MDVFVIDADVDDLSTPGPTTDTSEWFDLFVTSGVLPEVTGRSSDIQAYGAAPTKVAGRVLTVFILFSAALCGNLIMCCAVLKTPCLRTVTNIFTINLAVTDLLVTMFILPTWMVSMATGMSYPKGQAPFANSVCQTTAFLTVMFLLVSIATLAGISLDRYFSICHPLRYPMEVTSRRVYLVLGYIWAQSTALASAPMYGCGQYTFRPQAIAICIPDWANHPPYGGLMLSMGLAFPFSLMLFSYIRIVQEARKQVSRIEQIQLKLVSPVEEAPPPGVESNSKERGPDALRRKSIFQRMQIKKHSSNKPKTYSAFMKNLKTLKIVFIVVGAFITCWGPYIGVTIWATASGVRVPVTTDFVTTLLVFANSAMNPLVFIFLTRDFRFGVRMLFARVARCLGREDAVLRLRRESGMGYDSVMETVRFHSRGSCDSGVSDMGQDNRGLTLGEEDSQAGHTLRVPTTRPGEHVRAARPEDKHQETDESDTEVWSRQETSRPADIFQVRVDFHRESSGEDYSDSHNDSIPLLAIRPPRGFDTS